MFFFEASACIEYFEVCIHHIYLLVTIGSDPINVLRLPYMYTQRPKIRAFIHFHLALHAQRCAATLCLHHLLFLSFLILLRCVPVDQHLMETYFSLISILFITQNVHFNRTNQKQFFKGLQLSPLIWRGCSIEIPK